MRRGRSRIQGSMPAFARGGPASFWESIEVDDTGDRLKRQLVVLHPHRGGRTRARDNRLVGFGSTSLPGFHRAPGLLVDRGAGQDLVMTLGCRRARGACCSGHREQNIPFLQIVLRVDEVEVLLSPSRVTLVASVVIGLSSRTAVTSNRPVMTSPGRRAAVKFHDTFENTVPGLAAFRRPRR